MAKGRKATAGHKTGHRKDAGEQEPTSASLPAVADELATCPPPADLQPDGAAAQAWSICISEMSGNRHVREPDLILLRSYVMAVHVHEEACASILEHGAFIPVYAKVPGTDELFLDDNEKPILVGQIPNNAIKVRDAAANQMRYYSDILGLNPLARIRQNLAEISAGSQLLGMRDKLIKQMGG